MVNLKSCLGKAWGVKQVLGTTCFQVNKSFSLANSGDHVAMYQSCLSY